MEKTAPGRCFHELSPRATALESHLGVGVGWGGTLPAGQEPVTVAPGRAAPLPSIRQMSGQRSRGSVDAYQADERAGVARLCWRVSGR